MKPAELQASSFTRYPPEARQFALEHLTLLRALPLTVCPSFLKQIRALDTSFPAEKAVLTGQCRALEALDPAVFSRLTEPLAQIHLSPELEAANWVQTPAEFIAKLTAHLWSSGQLDRFRNATQALFAVIPAQENTTQRLVVVIFAKDLQRPAGAILRKLKKHGVAFTALETETVSAQLAALVTERSRRDTEPYAHWYVDGADAVPALATIPGFTRLSFAGARPLRERVLERMEHTLDAGNGGPEQMRDRLAETRPEDVDGRELTPDPVLQRFFTELFTESSGPQIFSTSFVQWSGREIARRVQPATLILRYTTRQRNRDMNQMLTTPGDEPDAEGSFRDAEMGAFYNWIEMDRISAPGHLSFAVLLEGHPEAVIVSARAAAGTQCATRLTFRDALANFG